MAISSSTKVESPVTSTDFLGAIKRDSLLNCWTSAISVLIDPASLLAFESLSKFELLSKGLLIDPASPLAFESLLKEEPEKFLGAAALIIWP